MRHGVERVPALSPMTGPILECIASARRACTIPSDLPPHAIRIALEAGVRADSPRAMVLLGRIHAGLDEELRRCAGMAGRRRAAYAASLFMKAAELGLPEGWLALAEYYAGEPGRPMAALLARHFFERAAERGCDAARLRLGRLLLEGPSAADSERAIALLQPLALRGEPEARALLARLVLPAGGDALRARSVVCAVAPRQPLLSARLELARVFGLRLHEALTVDVEGAYRPWGLLVDTGPFFRQPAKKVRRPVPAIDRDACTVLDRAVTVFRRHAARFADEEGSYRRRLYRLRRILAREGVTESLFFAQSSGSNVEDSAP
jgi:hypothetical protein